MRGRLWDAWGLGEYFFNVFFLNRKLLVFFLEL